MLLSILHPCGDRLWTKQQQAWPTIPRISLWTNWWILKFLEKITISDWLQSPSIQMQSIITLCSLTLKLHPADFWAFIHIFYRKQEFFLVKTKEKLSDHFSFSRESGMEHKNNILINTKKMNILIQLQTYLNQKNPKIQISTHSPSNPNPSPMTPKFPCPLPVPRPFFIGLKIKPWRSYLSFLYTSIYKYKNVA